MAWDRIAVGAAALLGLLGGGASLYSRASLAAVEGRVSVLESQRVEDKESIRDMKTKIDSIYTWLLDERRQAATRR